MEASFDGGESGWSGGSHCAIVGIEIEHLQTVGEGGMIVAPPTLVNAIEDALAPFGVRIYEQHLPPARILELIESSDSTALGKTSPIALTPTRTIGHHRD